MQVYNEILQHPKLDELTKLVMRHLPTIRRWKDLKTPIATRKTVGHP